MLAYFNRTMQKKAMPNLMLFNLHGQLPHIIDESYIVNNEPPNIYQISLPTIYPLIENNTNDNLNQILCKELDKKLFLTFYTPTTKCTDVSTKFSIKTSAGFKKFTAQSYWDLIRKTQPLYAHIPADIVMNPYASTNRFRKSHIASLKFLQDFLALTAAPNKDELSNNIRNEQNNETNMLNGVDNTISNHPKNVHYIASLTGDPLHIVERIRTTQELLLNIKHMLDNIHGFVIENVYPYIFCNKPDLTKITTQPAAEIKIFDNSHTDVISNERDGINNNTQINNEQMGTNVKKKMKILPLLRDKNRCLTPTHLDYNGNNNNGLENQDEHVPIELVKKSVDHYSKFLTTIIDMIPTDKLKIIQGPLDLLHLCLSMRAGVDLLDNSYAYVLTETGLVLNIAFNTNNAENNKNAHNNCNEKLNSQLEIIENNSNHIMISDPLLLNLVDSKFKSDPNAINDDCKCYTCKNYSRAYLNHLIVCHEMLSGVLLNIHNIHCYNTFFSHIRKLLYEEQNEEFEKIIENLLIFYANNTHWKHDYI